MPRDTVIIQTGTANTASVMAGLARAGARTSFASGPDQIEKADRVVLPGVGALAAAIGRLEQDDLVGALRTRILAGRPTLAICLGLQLLCDTSEESPEARGLGLMAAAVRRYPATVTVPQMGWNRIEPESGCQYLKGGFAYFANSYRLDDVPPGWSAAWSDHGGLFVGAAERGDVLACQFHPELSGTWGHDLLNRWIERGSSC